jgi:hypothetical protein
MGPEALMFPSFRTVRRRFPSQGCGTSFRARELSCIALGTLIALSARKSHAAPDEASSKLARGGEELALAHTATSPRAGGAVAVPAIPSPSREILRAAEAPDARGGEPSTSLPWVHADEIGRPDSLGDPLFESSLPDFSPWMLFEDKLDKRRAPADIPEYLENDLLPLYYVPPPRETEMALKIKKLIRKKVYREIRSKVRREWKNRFRESPSITFAQYEQRLLPINHIGREPSEYDTFDVEYATIETKQDIFRYKNRDGEADIPLLTLGPLIFTDSGEVQFDVGSAAHTDDVKLDVGADQKKCLVGGKDYRVGTRLNFSVDPLRAFNGNDIRGTVRSYGVTVEVDWLTDVLSRDTVAAEIECEADLQGDYAVFANFVLKGR